MPKIRIADIYWINISLCQMHGFAVAQEIQTFLASPVIYS